MDNYVLIKTPDDDGKYENDIAKITNGSAGPNLIEVTVCSWLHKRLVRSSEITSINHILIKMEQLHQLTKKELGLGNPDTVEMESMIRAFKNGRWPEQKDFDFMNKVYRFLTNEQ